MQVVAEGAWGLRLLAGLTVLFDLATCDVPDIMLLTGHNDMTLRRQSLCYTVVVSRSSVPNGPMSEPRKMLLPRLHKSQEARSQFTSDATHFCFHAWASCRAIGIRKVWSA